MKKKFVIIITMLISFNFVFAQTPKLIIKKKDMSSDTLLISDIKSIIFKNENSVIKDTSFKNISIYPNPAKNFLEIKFYSASSEHASWDIFDFEGNKIKHFEDVLISNGNNTLIWDLKDGKGENVAIGTYFLQIKSIHFNINQKIIVE